MRFSAIALLCLAAIVTIGCRRGDEGPELGEVSGRVTLDGKPLFPAMVIFAGLDSRTSTGRTDEDGHYTLQYTADKPGAIVGMNRVKITTNIAGTQDPKLAQLEERVPERYHGDEKFSVLVEHGKNTFDFALTSEEE
jgi:hypothetical protein